MGEGGCRLLVDGFEANAMGEGTETLGTPRGDRRAFYVVWSPQGGDPVVRHEAFGPARQAAWRLSEKYPGQDFFVLKSCWGRLARQVEISAVEGETPVAVEPDDEREAV